MTEYDANMVNPAESYLAEKKPVVWFWGRSERNYPHNHPMDIAAPVVAQPVENRTLQVNTRSTRNQAAQEESDPLESPLSPTDDVSVATVGTGIPALESQHQQYHHQHHHQHHQHHAHQAPSNEIMNRVLRPNVPGAVNSAGTGVYPIQNQPLRYPGDVAPPPIPHSNITQRRSSESGLTGSSAAVSFPSAVPVVLLLSNNPSSSNSHSGPITSSTPTSGLLFNNVPTATGVDISPNVYPHSTGHAFVIAPPIAAPAGYIVTNNDAAALPAPRPPHYNNDHMATMAFDSSYQHGRQLDNGVLPSAGQYHSNRSDFPMAAPTNVAPGPPALSMISEASTVYPVPGAFAAGYPPDLPKPSLDGHSAYDNSGTSPENVVTSIAANHLAPPFDTYSSTDDDYHNTPVVMEPQLEHRISQVSLQLQVSWKWEYLIKNPRNQHQ